MKIIIDKHEEFKGIRSDIKELSRLRLNELLQKHVEDTTDKLLGREKHRKTVVGKLEKDVIVCPKCKENWTRSFVRNGYSKRTLCTLQGIINLRLPIIKCKKCGKKFRLNDLLIPRYSHTWYDIQSFCAELYGSRCSFGMIQQILYRSFKEWFGKYTLMNIVRKIPVLPKQGKCPKEIGLDAFWIRSGTDNNNAVVLLATNNDDHSLMDFMWAPSESEASWRTFVEHLEKNFALNPKDLQNIVSDGNKGILRATDSISRHRTLCFFHILQNILQNSKDKNIGKKMMKEAAAILKKESFEETIQAMKPFIKKWQNKEPSAVHNFFYSLGKTKDAWKLSDKFSTTNNITENMIRQIRRKSRQMDNFRSKETTYACLEMIKEQVGKFSTFGDWFTPIEKRLVCA